MTGMPSTQSRSAPYIGRMPRERCLTFSLRKSSTLVPAACCPFEVSGSKRMDEGIRSVL